MHYPLAEQLQPFPRDYQNQMASTPETIQDTVQIGVIPGMAPVVVGADQVPQGDQGITRRGSPVWLFLGVGIVVAAAVAGFQEIAIARAKR